MVVFQTFVLKNVKAIIFEYVIMIEHLTFYVDIVIKRWYSDRVFFYLIYCHLIHLWYRFVWLSIVGCLMSSGNIDVYWIHIQGENKFNNASKKTIQK